MFDWIIGLVDQTGYVGIALLMLAENVFPPIPSELIKRWLGLSEQALRLDRWNVCRVQAAAICGSLVK
jgi:membrane protein DedA with SNARE-associated domain